MNTLKIDKMIVELISFHYNLAAQKRLELMTNLVNISKADLLVACGNTLENQHDVSKLSEQIPFTNATGRRYQAISVGEHSEEMFKELKDEE